MNGSISNSIADWAVSVMNTLGGPGAGLLIALENLFPPLPSEIILPLAGFAAARGEIGLVEAIIWTTIGSVVGAVALYYIGQALGRDRMRRLAYKMPLVSVEEFDKTERWFKKHDTKAVFFGRMLPLFRSFISIPAGLEKMPMGKFLLYTAAGSLIWNTIFVVAGYQLGANWHVVEEYAGIFKYAVLAIVALGLGYYIVRRSRMPR